MASRVKTTPFDLGRAAGQPAFAKVALDKPAVFSVELGSKDGGDPSQVLPSARSRWDSEGMSAYRPWTQM
eukprot:s392_g11.t3